MEHGRLGDTVITKGNNAVTIALSRTSITIQVEILFFSDGIEESILAYTALTCCFRVGGLSVMIPTFITSINPITNCTTLWQGKGIILVGDSVVEESVTAGGSGTGISIDTGGTRFMTLFTQIIILLVGSRIIVPIDATCATKLTQAPIAAEVAVQAQRNIHRPSLVGVLAVLTRQAYVFTLADQTTVLTKLTFKTIGEARGVHLWVVGTRRTEGTQGRAL
jgi:hypothetical protein